MQVSYIKEMAAAEQPVELLQSARRHVHPLASVTPQNDDSDLAPLGEILRGVRILGLGESTHGTREFFQLKHRITRYLVERHGYRVFSIEAGTLPSRNIDDYVRKGKGDRAQALASVGYWTWDTEEVTALIDWLREYNLSAPRGDEVRFAGIDIKPIDDALRTLREILPRVCRVATARAEPILRTVESHEVQSRQPGSIDLEGIYWLLGWLTARAAFVVERAGVENHRLAVEAARQIFQFIDSLIVNPGVKTRDKHMSENAALLFDSLPANTRIIVWAHNAHLAIDPEWQNLGFHLRRRYGKQYYAAALTFTEGAFQSRLERPGEDRFGPLLEFSADSADRNLWEHDLASLHDGDFYLDLRGAAEGDPETLVWSRKSVRPLHSIGGLYNPDAVQDERFFSNYALGTAFDGLFHLQRTTRALPTLSGQRDDGDPIR